MALQLNRGESKWWYGRVCHVKGLFATAKWGTRPVGRPWNTSEAARESG